MPYYDTSRNQKGKIMVKPSITVVVADGRYNMYGAPSLKTTLLAMLLKGMGGVNEHVPDGTYNFSVGMKGLSLVLSLDEA